MLIVTTEYISGKELEMLGMVKGSTIQTKHLGKDITQSLKTLVGGELTAYTEMMNDARALATKRMVQEAEALGADAIVGVAYASSAVMQGAVAKLDLLVDIHIYLMNLLDTKGKLKMQTGVGDVSHLAEGGHNGLLLIVHGIKAGQNTDHCNQRHHGDQKTCQRFDKSLLPADRHKQHQHSAYNEIHYNRCGHTFLPFSL